MAEVVTTVPRRPGHTSMSTSLIRRPLSSDTNWCADPMLAPGAGG